MWMASVRSVHNLCQWDDFRHPSAGAAATAKLCPFSSLKWRCIHDATCDRDHLGSVDPASTSAPRYDVFASRSEQRRRAFITTASSSSVSPAGCRSSIHLDWLLISREEPISFGVSTMF